MENLFIEVTGNDEWKWFCLFRKDIIFLQPVMFKHTDDAKAMIMFYMKGNTSDLAKDLWKQYTLY